MSDLIIDLRQKFLFLSLPHFPRPFPTHLDRQSQASIASSRSQTSGSFYLDASTSMALRLPELQPYISITGSRKERRVEKGSLHLF